MREKEVRNCSKMLASTPRRMELAEMGLFDGRGLGGQEIDHLELKIVWGDIASGMAKALLACPAGFSRAGAPVTVNMTLDPDH